MFEQHDCDGNPDHNDLPKFVWFLEMQPALSVKLTQTLMKFTGDLMGRALEMTVPNSVPGQPPQKHDFAFDRVFAPSVGQVRGPTAAAWGHPQVTLHTVQCFYQGGACTATWQIRAQHAAQ